MMTVFRFLCRIFLLVQVHDIFIGQVEALLWRTEQTVDYYTHYASVTPTRFPVLANTGEATWHFRATKSSDGCKHKTLSIYLQFGSLPVVNPLNETFPDNFFLKRNHMTELKVPSDNSSVSHTELFPQVGDWYASAFLPGSNDRITQKGLTVSCKYKFSASMEVKELPPHLYMSVNQESQVALRGPHGDGVWVGFTVPTSTLSIDFEVRNCTLASCEMRLSTLSDETGRQITVHCTQVDRLACILSVPSPRVGVKRYVRLQLLSQGNTTVVVTLSSDDCSSAEELTNSTQSCLLENKLDRYQKPDDFNTDFIHMDNNTVQKNEYFLSNNSVSVVPFTVERMTDVGGTLNVKVSFKKEDVAENQQVRVCGQVLLGQFPALTSDLDLCVNATNSLQVNSSAKDSDRSVSDRIYVPYPEEGLWMLALGFQCYNATNGSSEVVDCVNGTQKVRVTVKIQSCVDGECNGQGVCKEYIKSSDFIVFSTCDCTAGWKGYGCTDGREAFSDASQLVEVLLLTLSNLFFLPAIFVAVYRRYYIEAICYFYNMFFSTFYHACDGDRIDKYVYCLTKYPVLAAGDFLASTVSLWVTLIAMAQIPVNFSSALQMAGPLALIIGVLLDRTSLWVIAVPTGVGLIILLVCWVMQCCRTKRCFPDRRRYVWMLPGVLFAVAGAVMFAFFETAKNYKYIHSAWHVCLSLSIIFLLPPRRKEKVSTSVNFDDTESTEGLVLGPNNYTRRMNFEL